MPRPSTSRTPRCPKPRASLAPSSSSATRPSRTCTERSSSSTGARNLAPLPANTFDFILTARSVHGWIRNPGMVEKAFKDFAGALKPGGILALEQHRANPGPQDMKAVSGYVTEAFVIEQAEKAGLKLAARSEINANPEGHQGSSVRRLDVAADASLDALWRRCNRSRVRSLEVRGHRGERPHDAQVRQAEVVDDPGYRMRFDLLLAACAAVLLVGLRRRPGAGPGGRRVLRRRAAVADARRRVAAPPRARRRVLRAAARAQPAARDLDRRSAIQRSLRGLDRA